MTEQVPQPEPDHGMTDDEAITHELLKEPGLADEWIRQNTLIYGGLIGIGVVLVQPYIGGGHPPVLGLVAVVSFAVAIPLLAVLMLLSSQEAFRHRVSRSKAVSVARGFAMAAACIGTVAAFWQISWIAGVAVLVSGAFAVGVQSVGYTKLEPGMMQKATTLSLRRMAARRAVRRAGAPESDRRDVDAER